MLGKVLLVGIHKSIHPWQPCLLAVVCVENDRNSVESSDLTHMKGSSNRSSNGCLIVSVVGLLSGNELSSSLGEGDHNGTSVFSGGFHAGIDRVGSNNIDSWNGEAFLLGVVEKVDKRLSCDDTWLDRSRELLESLNFSRIIEAKAKF